MPNKSPCSPVPGPTCCTPLRYIFTPPRLHFSFHFLRRPTDDLSKTMYPRVRRFFFVLISQMVTLFLRVPARQGPQTPSPDEEKPLHNSLFRWNVWAQPLGPPFFPPLAFPPCHLPYFICRMGFFPRRPFSKLFAPPLFPLLLSSG